MSSKSKRVDIALFVPSLRGGGAERVMVNLARGFSEQGYKVDLVLQRAEGPFLSKVPDEVRIVDLRTKRMALALFPLISYLRREKPRSLLAAMTHTNIVALLARKLARVETRVVVSEHNTISIISHTSKTLRSRFLPLIAKRLYYWADAVIAVSKGVADDFAEFLKFPREKIRVIYNPVVTPEILEKAEEPLEHPWFKPGEPPVILGVGALTKQKDFPTLIHAFALVRRERPARLVILGKGEERPRLEALVRELDLEKDVALPGFVDNPYKYMKHAAVFVLSSRWEGLPTVLIEAMACGTPVVTTDCPSGPREILEEGKYGALVPVGDARELAKAIMKALVDTSQREIIKAKLYEFSLESAVGKYMDVLLGRSACYRY